MHHQKIVDMTERKLLNDRFKVVFKALVERGEIVKNSRQKGMSNFAEKIMGNKSYGHIVRAYLKEHPTRVITYEQAHLLIKHYDVSRDYLFEGILPIFASEQVDGGSPKSDERPTLDSVAEPTPTYQTAEMPKTNVLFSTMSAFASSTVDVNIMDATERFYIPGMQGEHIAFYIKGASMTPTIADGDMVICRAIEQHERIFENEIYAIVTNAGNVMVKRIQKILGKNRQLKGIKCISDNYLEHDPFTLALHEVRKLLKVERKLTDIGL